jgi:hypothetical protein
LACKPFLGEVLHSTPDGFIALPNKYNKLPEEELILTRAIGVRNQYIKDRVRGQVKYSVAAKSVVFPTACLGVIMDRDTLAQKFVN